MDIVTFSVIIGALLAISEALSLIPQVRANGLFQVIWNILKMVAGEKRD